MFKGKTVFILGAGASMPFGFPSGYDLVSIIRNNLIKQDKLLFLAGALKNLHQAEEDKIDDFKNALSRTIPMSIDDFLEARPEFLTIGKAAIAQALIPFEDENKLYDRENRKNWYPLIFEELRINISSLQNNQICFITFNYDRSLEHFLFTQLVNYLRLDSQSSISVMNKIPIIHLYGHLGFLPWQNPDNNRAYMPQINEYTIVAVSSYLCVIHEGKEVIDNFTRAQELIRKSDKVRFLGYGFHETNNKRLNFDQDTAALNIAGTAMGFSKLEKKQIINQFFANNINLDDGDRDIVRYFKEVDLLE